jgi:hypothetical protein
MLFHYCGSFSMLPRYCLGNLVGVDVLNCCHLHAEIVALVIIAFWKLSEWKSFVFWNGLCMLSVCSENVSCLVILAFWKLS